MKQPALSVYDVFAYLVSGSIALASIDLGFYGGRHIAENPTVIEGALYVWLSYGAGHLVAELSAWLYERVLVARVLGWPAEVLFGSPKRGSQILKQYTRALPEPIRARILERSGAEAGITRMSEALFDYCEAAVRAAGISADRSAAFLALSGFARNASCAAFVASLVLAVAWVAGALPDGQWGYVLASAAAGVGLCVRYLTLFRRYTREILVTYATLPPTGTTS